LAAKGRTTKRPGRAQNLNPVKPGEVRNPKGINGWTAARERVKVLLAAHSGDITEVMARLAKAGDVAAAKLLLGPLLPAQEVKLDAEGTITVRFEREKEQKK
jgi:hypothetical protein